MAAVSNDFLAPYKRRKYVYHRISHFTAEGANDSLSYTRQACGSGFGTSGYMGNIILSDKQENGELGRYRRREPGFVFF